MGIGAPLDLRTAWTTVGGKTRRACRWTALGLRCARAQRRYKAEGVECGSRGTCEPAGVPTSDVAEETGAKNTALSIDFHRAGRLRNFSCRARAAVQSFLRWIEAVRRRAKLGRRSRAPRIAQWSGCSCCDGVRVSAGEEETGVPSAACTAQLRKQNDDDGHLHMSARASDETRRG